MIQITVYSCDQLGKAVQDDISLRIQEKIFENFIDMREVVIIFASGLTNINAVQTKKSHKDLRLETHKTENQIFIKIEVFGQYLNQEDIKYQKSILGQSFKDFGQDIKHIVGYTRIAI